MDSATERKPPMARNLRFRWKNLGSANGFGANTHR
jgi:hypothetical protein